MNNLTVDATAVIADLGCSIKLKSPFEKLTFKIGTPGYMAPEIIKGEPYGLPVDIWSLGCLLHVLLTATPPFWDDDRTTRNERVCNEPLNLQGDQYLSVLSTQAKNLLNRLLTKDPERRPTI